MTLIKNSIPKIAYQIEHTDRTPSLRLLIERNIRIS